MEERERLGKPLESHGPVLASDSTIQKVIAESDEERLNIVRRKRLQVCLDCPIG